ncbi:DUF4123 domain-containing protein [Janthinobacterium agaricidamnosum]|uniref:DUF4123 domain-containing protein n=1 Tax=Janthinobacterium agaricidamnosum NBRC 102515 = DSM 9628 TaxID=1349767 RepID=W0VBT3_9BURK|nr:DUF4123 domain-containing protein [Janthinobacterium agaricidamnosum]CDG84818.1 hypothetical protein GJA_4208 [Janthinobacterium agaricidamnosum NBRC 102515 = DSM 9628]
MNINSYPPDWYVSLDRQLQALQHEFPDAHIYALVDGVFDETCYPLLKRAANLPSNLPYIALFAQTSGADEETLGLSPLLVQFADAGSVTWKLLLKKTDGHPSLSLIVTPESLAQLAARLLPWCMVDADGHTLLLSFADTRILPELCKILTVQQLSQLCGPACHWQYVRRTGEWDVLALPVAALPAAGQVSLDARQCARLMTVSEADGILFQVRASRPDLLSGHTPERAHDLVQYWLGCADHAQIAGNPGRLDVCQLGLKNPGLQGQPQLAQWLAEPSRAQTVDALLEQWTSGKEVLS